MKWYVSIWLIMYLYLEKHKIGCGRTEAALEKWGRIIETVSDKLTSAADVCLSAVSHNEESEGASVCRPAASVGQTQRVTDTVKLFI